MKLITVELYGVLSWSQEQSYIRLTKAQAECIVRVMSAYEADEAISNQEAKNLTLFLPKLQELKRLTDEWFD
jgi:hypothetical protein